MRKIALATAIGAAMTLSACGSDDTSGTFSTEDGEGSYSIDADGGDVNIEASNDDGDFSLVIGEGLVADLPQGFSTYPGAEIISKIEVNQDDGAGVIVVMQSDDTPEELADFYLEQAKDAGFKIELEMNAGGSRIIGGETDDGQVFNFNASANDGEVTNAQLMVGMDLE